MKKIIFNDDDRHPNIGQEQHVEDPLAFATERELFLPNPKVEGDKLTFDIQTGDPENPVRRGFATISDISDEQPVENNSGILSKMIKFFS